MSYKGITLTSQPSLRQLQDACLDYEEILLANLEFIIDRFNATPGYLWIDTKFDLITEKDFPKDDCIKGLDTVYAWIQGRAMESIAEILSHRKLLKNKEKFEKCASAAERLLAEVLHNMYRIWKENNGHLSFMMTSSGQPIRLDSKKQIRSFDLTGDSPYTITDIFCAKGMFAAAAYLGEKEILEHSLDYCLEIYDATFQGQLVNDQVVFDAKNPGGAEKGKRSHAPFMLQIGTAILLAQYSQLPNRVEMGLKLVKYIIDHYVNIPAKWPELQVYDFVEFIDTDNHPYLKDGSIISDSGHALEFAGLALMLMRVLEQKSELSIEQKDNIEQYKALMYSIMKQNFKNGFAGSSLGICKTFDLLSRCPVNTDMPWWSLPETMRTSVECWSVMNESDCRKECLEIFSACHNALMLHYIRPTCHCLATQTLDAAGDITDKIPATPDLDPCYHTGLSLLSCCMLLK